MKLYLSKSSLNGKVAFVAGGSGLIGQETVSALAEAGAKVVILDIDSAKAKNCVQQELKKGFDVSFEKVDLTQLEMIESVFAKLVKKYGRMDVWVNLSYPRTKDWGQSIEKLNVKNLRNNSDWQFVSTLLATKIVAGIMKVKKIKGSIINCGSIYGVQANDFSVYEGTSMTGPYAYAGIKGGVINATRYIASYFGKYGIRANTVCPGGIFDQQNPKFVKNYNKKVPLQRMGTADEIASAILFLASDASSYITGTAFMVDGGWTIV